MRAVDLTAAHGGLGDWVTRARNKSRFDRWSLLFLALVTQSRPAKPGSQIDGAHRTASVLHGLHWLHDLHAKPWDRSRRHQDRGHRSGRQRPGDLGVASRDAA